MIIMEWVLKRKIRLDLDQIFLSSIPRSAKITQGRVGGKGWKG